MYYVRPCFSLKNFGKKKRAYYTEKYSILRNWLVQLWALVGGTFAGRAGGMGAQEGWTLRLEAEGSLGPEFPLPQETSAFFS